MTTKQAVKERPLIKVFPTNEVCKREIGLDKAGVPITCLNPGYMKIGDAMSCPLCMHHAEEKLDAIENLYQKHKLAKTKR